jgi:predicted NUDIX family phosphoesterase
MNEEDVMDVVEVPTEQVLCFPRSILDFVGDFPKSILLDQAECAAVMQELLTGGELEFVDREEAEVSPDWVQLIPYCVLFRGREVFHYRRKGSEGRLNGQLSIGVGGHINPVDGTNLRDGRFYERALRRELLEEVGYDLPAVPPIHGLIYDATTAVGRVHMGVVHLVTLPRNHALQVTDPALQNGDFQHITELVNTARFSPQHFENWSTLLLHHSFA